MAPIADGPKMAWIQVSYNIVSGKAFPVKLILAGASSDMCLDDHCIHIKKM